MLGLVVLMVTFLGFPLWCMAGAAGMAKASSAVGEKDSDAGTDGAHR